MKNLKIFRGKRNRSMPQLPTTEDGLEDATRRSQIDLTESRSRPSFFNRLKAAFRSRSPSREAAPVPAVLSKKEVVQRNDQSDAGDMYLEGSRASSVPPEITVEPPLGGNEALSRIETEGPGMAVKDATPGAPAAGQGQSSAQVTQLGVKESSLDPAVVEAARAAASQTVIEMKGGAAPVSAIASGISGMDNPIDVVDSMSFFLTTLSTFNSVLDKMAQIHPYAQAAWTILSFASKAIVNQNIRDGSIVSLLKKMNDVYIFLTAADLRDIESMKGIVEQICRQTLECSYFIREYAQNTKFRTRLLKNLISNTNARVQEFNGVFDDLLKQFHDKAAHDTLIVVHRIWEDVAELAQDSDLQHMPYVQGAGLNLQKVCLEGTREQILKDVIDWLNSNDDSSRIFWLHGNAGRGKSSIAHTIANYFDKLGRLGSCFCFDRNKFAEERHNKIFTVIAQDLAHTDKNIRKELAGIVHLNKALSNTSDIVQQWKELVVKPLRKLSETMVGPIVIVIDALDESGNPESRRHLLRILAGMLNDDDSHVLKLPPQVRIVLTSRALPDISNVLTGVNHVCSMSMESISTDSTSRDIFQYVSAELQGLDIDKIQLDRLTSASDGLFEWARLACAYIKGNDDAGSSIKERTDDVFARNQAEQVPLLDSMYMLTLGAVFPQSQHKRDVRLGRFRSVMAQILGNAEPLPLAALASMRGYFLDDDLKKIDVESIINPMGALLSGTSSSFEVIRPLHASFAEFLMDRKRSGEFFIDVSHIHVHLVAASMGIMKDQLQFNICQLPSSYLPNSAVEDLDQRIRDNISLGLSYSCRFWTHHLQQAKYCVTLADIIREFFNHERLLFWIEILSLLKLVNTCAGSMSAIIEWTKSAGDCVDLVNYATDLQKFVRTFGGAISHSTPHLYLSAIPFSPKKSHINMAFGDRFCKLLCMDTGRNMNWPIIQGILRGHENEVNCVAFSPDGKHIVSSSYDKTLRLWDAETGEQIGAPLEGHQNFVLSVAFAPNGKRIISGSYDKTLRLWDAETGEQIGAPLEGHQKPVKSVAFAPNGKRIVSGSNDCTLRLWNTETGKQIGAPLEGHEYTVQSVAFAPDGKRIVSGSYDKTLRLWDAETGKQIGAPLEGHEYTVQSVAFSPDGKKIVSGSNDTTLRLWDAETGKQIGAPLEGHEYPIQSVAFSPDGKRIVSGSDDKTLRLWDAETGEQIGAPLEGHQNSINSVAFSPDGKRIVSGSYDKTLWLWDAETGKQIGAPLEGHQNFVLSVAFAPNGKRIISGSYDKTLRLWDAETGEQIGAPLEGHQNSINSVAFSPDGKRIVSGSYDKTLRLWDAETGKQIGAPLEGHEYPIQSVAFSPNGKRIVSGSYDKTLRLWDAETGKQIGAPLEGHEYTVQSVAFSPDGKKIVSGSNDTTLRLWDAETGKQIGAPLEGHEYPIQSVAFSPDGKRIVSGSDDKTLWLWDAETGKQIGAPLKGHQNSILSVAFSPDGKRIVSGSYDKTLQLWDAETREQIGAPLEGHQNPVQSVAFSPDGKRIISGSYDKTLRLWDAETREQIGAPLEGHQNSIIFSLQPQSAFPIIANTIQKMDLSFDLLQTQNLHNFLQVPYPYFPWQGNGWVICKSASKNGKLLFFVPSMYNVKQYWPPSLKLIMPSPPQLNLSQMAHGESWASIYPNSNVQAV
ncbi:Vegetative incompatibility protein HET-E-1 [Psilocybe cubensis]|nr:Vegetative incompatibility protein HET-E-1 [Psilocybe cubensis]KAH9487260.1 Vegetative incompatibility protein HET-E-1 [Psilocybe cubensis]